MTRSKKIQHVADMLGEALEASKNGYTAIAVQNEDGSFNLSVQKEMLPPHWSEDFETVEELESEMRDFVSDLRRWTWVTW